MTWKTGFAAPLCVPGGNYFHSGNIRGGERAAAEKEGLQGFPGRDKFKVELATIS